MKHFFYTFVTLVIKVLCFVSRLYQERIQVFKEWSYEIKFAQQLRLFKWIFINASFKIFRYFIFTSFWAYKIYYVYGFMLLVIFNLWITLYKHSLTILFSTRFSWFSPLSQFALQ